MAQYAHRSWFFLGGARPKASVLDTRKNLWIAKFPSKNDEKDIAA